MPEVTAAFARHGRDVAVGPATAKADGEGRFRVRYWTWIAAAGIIVALLNVVSYRAEDAASNVEQPLSQYFVCEITGVLMVLILLPGLIWLVVHAPIRRDTIRWALPLHLLACVAFGLLHTLLMWGSRSAIWAIAGWGTYNFGPMRLRFLAEFENQVIVYGAVYVIEQTISHWRRRRREEMRNVRLGKQLSDARLTALRSQLDPHFLFNTLNMISSFIHTDPDLADRLVSRLSDLLRLTLRDASANEVTVARELEILTAYTSIMLERFRDLLDVTLDCDQTCRQALIPSLLLQPLVENAIKHGLESEGGGRVWVSLRCGEGKMRVLVEDDGAGLQGAPRDPMGGVGLSNTRDRLEEMYGARARLAIGERPGGGCRVEVVLPLRLHADEMKGTEHAFPHDPADRG